MTVVGTRPQGFRSRETRWRENRGELSLTRSLTRGICEEGLVGGECGRRKVELWRRGGRVHNYHHHHRRSGGVREIFWGRDEQLLIELPGGWRSDQQGSLAVPPQARLGRCTAPLRRVHMDRNKRSTVPLRLHALSTVLILNIVVSCDVRRTE